MSAGLHQHALGSIDEDDGEVGKRCTDCHVSRVFLMSRRVRNDKAAVVCSKIAVSDVNRNALLALRHKAVEQQRIVNFTAAAADLAFQLERLFLIGVQLLGIV